MNSASIENHNISPGRMQPSPTSLRTPPQVLPILWTHCNGGHRRFEPFAKSGDRRHAMSALGVSVRSLATIYIIQGPCTDHRQNECQATAISSPDLPQCNCHSVTRCGTPRLGWGYCYDSFTLPERCLPENKLNPKEQAGISTIGHFAEVSLTESSLVFAECLADIIIFGAYDRCCALRLLHCSTWSSACTLSPATPGR
jgi:hypothetical protein